MKFSVVTLIKSQTVIVWGRVGGCVVWCRFKTLELFAFIMRLILQPYKSKSNTFWRLCSIFMFIRNHWRNRYLSIAIINTIKHKVADNQQKLNEVWYLKERK